ncbi:MAG: hypothetical protein KDJ52_15485, partial [Anaerolineae bacterium]|nr:hypothetical protein [Anaerolineae bacterium]
MTFFLIILFWTFLTLFVLWVLSHLLFTFSESLDRLVTTLDNLRKVIFNSGMDMVQVRKSDKLADLDVEIAGAKFEHDRSKALIALDRIQDVTDLEVIERAHRLKMLQEQGRLSLRAQREALKSEVMQ